jgi:SAM-dependent methyltransferase
MEDRCFRVMTPDAGKVLQEFLNTDLAQRLIEEGKLIATRQPESVPPQLLPALGVSDWPVESPVFEHERIAFPNYPYEWPAEMFTSGAQLTLELAAAVLPYGFNLKDGSVWNVMFRGSEPVFLDLASFEKNPLERVWMPYGQFVRTFLLPLLIWRTTRVPPGQHFRVSRDGLKPEDCFRQLGFGRAIRPPALEICGLPTALAWWAGKRKKTTAALRPRLTNSLEEAEFFVSRLLRRLERSLKKIVEREPAGSAWTNYVDDVAERQFAPGYFPAKQKFVAEALDFTRPGSCLDIGCNTGYFSLMAANAGARVVGIDSDAASVGELYRKARREHQKVLPLVLDIARPTPALGWNNSESVAFLDRAERGRFEMVMMLALIHHLSLVERVPLLEVARLTCRLAPRWLLIEFVPREDPLAQRMPGGWIADSEWSPYDRASFEQVFGRYFLSVRAEEMANSGRWLYLMQRRPGGTA